jgi:hypothetical protein
MPQWCPNELGLSSGRPIGRWGCDFVNWIGNRIALSDRLCVVLAYFHVQSRLCITAVDAFFLSRSLFGFLPKHEQSALSGCLDIAVRVAEQEMVGMITYCTNSHVK